MDIYNDIWLWWPLMSKCFLSSATSIEKFVGMIFCAFEVCTTTEVSGAAAKATSFQSLW